MAATIREDAPYRDFAERLTRLRTDAGLTRAQLGEKIGVAPYLGTEAIWEAHPENDIALLEDVANESIQVATAGCFGIFFPWDAHRPALYLGDGPATSRKCDIKISMDLFDE